MWLLLLVVVLAGPCVVFFLSKQGEALREASAVPAPLLPEDAWPSVGMVIPAAGTHPDMEGAVRSLLEQSYPGPFKAAIVTAGEDEPAARMAERLMGDYPFLSHVVAGAAEGCGQKNHNSLKGVAALGEVDVYAFCDSTHKASPDFLRRMVAPIALKEASFTTGYHEVVPRDNELVTLSYTMCVIFLRLLQSMAKLTEPWGGAMCIERRLFEEKGIGEFWSTNVVDDCSLTCFLAEKGVRVRLSPGALLRTRAEHHQFDVWKAWLDRQILFLKFCVPVQWRLLGVLSLVVLIAPVFCLCTALLLLVGKASVAPVALSAVFVLCAALACARLRPLVARHVGSFRWTGAYLMTVLVFFASFCSTVPAKGILWRGLWYKVGDKGRVLRTERRG